MGTNARAVLYLLAMVAIVVAVDVLFLRHHFGLRLVVNIAILLVFIAVYVAFLRRP